MNGNDRGIYSFSVNFTSLYSLEKLIEWKFSARVSPGGETKSALYSLEKLIEWKFEIEDSLEYQSEINSLLAREIN